MLDHFLFVIVKLELIDNQMIAFEDFARSEPRRDIRALRGQGLGEKLCRAALAEAQERGVRYAYLQVVQDNAAAMNLYRKLGFSKAYTYWYMRQDV